MNIAGLYNRMGCDLKVEEFYERALEGYEAQLGKDNHYTKKYVENFKETLEYYKNSERPAELIESYPGLGFEEVD